MLFSRGPGCLYVSLISFRIPRRGLLLKFPLETTGFKVLTLARLPVLGKAFSGLSSGKVSERVAVPPKFMQSRFLISLNCFHLSLLDRNLLGAPIMVTSARGITTSGTSSIFTDISIFRARGGSEEDAALPRGTFIIAYNI